MKSSPPPSSSPKLVPRTEGTPRAAAKAAEPVKPVQAAKASDGFAALGLSAELLASITSLGYEEPTPVQRETIPLLLAGKDLLGQAATGTGKTAAFALPMLQRIEEADAGP